MTTSTTPPAVPPVPSTPENDPATNVAPVASAPSAPIPTHPGTEATLTHDAAPAADVERVGRGLLIAVGAVVLGVVAAGLLGWIGRFGMVGAWVASVGAVMGYAFGASGFREGKFPVLALMIVGTAASIVANIFGEFMKVYGEQKAKGFDLDEPVGFFFKVLPELITDKSAFGLIALSLVGLAFGLWRWFKFVMAHRQAA